MSERLKYTAFLHADKESNWDVADELGFSEIKSVTDKFIYSLYEVELDMEMDTETGETWILKVNGVELKEPVKG